MPETSGEEKHEFKAEVSAVLRLVTNSLYTNREIFIRELISNASDALDRARYEALVDKSIEGQELELQVTITIDKKRGILAIEDTGIGMNREAVAHDLGTIAHSGTLKFLEQAAAQQAAGKKADLGLIGQFGVGFYSAFMVADRIEVTTRSARPGNPAVRWSSTGGSGFTIAEAERDGRGTRVELHLKKEAKEFLEPLRVELVVKRYSNFVLHPIRLQVIKDDGEVDGEPRQINEAKAFWTRDPKDISDEDYAQFYKHVMGGFVMPGDEPLARLHLRMDAPLQFQSVLYVPGHRPADLFAEDSRHLQLYARRVLIMESCDKLLPVYLRFVRGVVDSEDLPLNVSREMLQEHQSLSAIRRQLSRKVLRLLSDTAKEDREKYDKLWANFGVFLKEGLHTDNAHRDELTELLRFSSTGRDGGLVSLKEYVGAMPQGQEAIYYITGDATEDLASSPHLEACRGRGYAVLLMNDAVDEWVVQDLSKYDDKPLRSVTMGDLGLPDSEKDADDDGVKAEFAPLLGRASEVLGERVTEVRPSKRLTQSAACLIDAEGGLGRNMERILKMAGRELPTRARILELNPGHDFVRAANALAAKDPSNARLGTWIELLFDQANLAEGNVPDPAGVVRRIQSVLDAAAKASTE